MRRLTGVVIGSVVLSGCAHGPGISAVTYQGQTIQLAQRYPDFEAYKDDPENLLAGDLDRIAGLVKGAVIPQRFATREQANDYLFDEVMFPGYGYSLMQLDKPVALYSIEVPQREEDRWITMVEKGGMWVVVDDFVWPESKGYIDQAVVDGAHIRYLDSKGNTLREK